MELQTERLQRETGAVSVECVVHFHDRQTRNRFVTLVSVSKDGRREPQSIAITRLATECWDASMLAIDKILENHESMGMLFKQAGYEVQQNRLLRLRLPLLSRALARRYNCKLWESAEVECFEFWASQKLYGVVCEIKNPRRFQAPSRPKRGYYATYQIVRHPLYGKALLPLALFVGVLMSIYFYFLCRYYAKRFIECSYDVIIDCA